MTPQAWQGNGRGLIGAAILALLGALGLVQIRIFEFTPPSWLRALLLVVLLGASAIAVFQAMQRPPDLPESLNWFPQSFTRPPSRRWRFVSKILTVDIAPGQSPHRRDADIDWRYALRNLSPRHLHEIEIPLIAEVAVQKSRMDLQVLEPASYVPRVIGGNSHSPLVQILFPHAGVKPKRTESVRLHYHWPGFADLAGDCYIQRLNDVTVGGTVETRVRFPNDAPIDHGEAFLVRRRFGVWLGRPSLGIIHPVVTAYGRELFLSHVKHRGDVLALLYTLGRPGGG
ncbi:MAG: hypothetical protein ACRDJG_08450 [Actinomycetota bacterium]